MKQKYYMIPFLVCLMAITTMIPATYARYVSKEEVPVEKASIAGVSVKAESQSSKTPVYPGNETVIGSVTINYSGSETKLVYDVILEFEEELPQGTKVYIDGKEATNNTAKKYVVSNIDTKKPQEDKITYDISIKLPESVGSVQEVNNCSVVVNAVQAF